METLSSCRTASLSKLVPNGYLDQVFPGHPDIEGLAREIGLQESEHCDQGDLSPREESGQNKKKTKANKIWNFVNRKKRPSSQGKRPQSMILLEDHSRPSELKTKITLLDRMKSFKRLKPSIRASKNSPPRNSKAQEHQKPSGIYWMRKAEEAIKPFRHSYAGHIEGLEPFLSGVQRPVHISKKVNQKVLAFDDFGIQVEEDSWEEEDPEQSSSSRWSRSYLKSMFLGDHEAPHTSGHSRIQEPKASIKGLTLEGHVEGSNEEKPGHLRQDRAMPFGGVIKFFSNVAEVTRKWRVFSRQESQMGHHREAYFVSDNKSFILEGTTSQGSYPLDLPCQPPEAALWDSAVGRCLHCQHKASQASDTFKMSTEGEEMSDKSLTTSALASASASSAIFEFQDDPMAPNGCSGHYSCAFTREHSSSKELNEDNEIVVSFLKESDSPGESPGMGTCVRRVTTDAIMEKLEEKPSETEEQKACRGPKGYSQAGQPQESNLGMGAVKAESKASKAYTGVPSIQVRWKLALPKYHLKHSEPPKPAKLLCSPHSPTFHQEYPGRNSPISQVPETRLILKSCAMFAPSLDRIPVVTPQFNLEPKLKLWEWKPSDLDHLMMSKTAIFLRLWDISLALQPSPHPSRR